MLLVRLTCFTISYGIIWNCPVSIKTKHTNRNSGEIFLSIKESCSECKSKIHIYYQNESIDDPTLYISTFDSREIAHDKKQQVRG